MAMSHRLSPSGPFLAEPPPPAGNVTFGTWEPVITDEENLQNIEPELAQWERIEGPLLSRVVCRVRFLYQRLTNGHSRSFRLSLPFPAANFVDEPDLIGHGAFIMQEEFPYIIPAFVEAVPATALASVQFFDDGVPENQQVGAISFGYDLIPPP